MLSSCRRDVPPNHCVYLCFCNRLKLFKNNSNHCTALPSPLKAYAMLNGSELNIEHGLSHSKVFGGRCAAVD